MSKHNSVRSIREVQMISKAELARRAKVTVQTINRIEKGYNCRLDTKRKIILALGYKLSDRLKVFSKNSFNDQAKINARKNIIRLRIYCYVDTRNFLKKYRGMFLEILNLKTLKNCKELEMLKAVLLKLVSIKILISLNVYRLHLEIL